jgi:hypothetical protein
LAILTTRLTKDQEQSVEIDVYNLFRKLKDNPLSANTFSFYVSVSAVFSCKTKLAKTGALSSRLHQKKLTICTLVRTNPLTD